ncbi:MAG: hypothetical protein KDA93_00585 [Planctomycetaceae bacterium]|nr:hypothetical protein [Planctomycetaceae bacterium]
MRVLLFASCLSLIPLTTMHGQEVRVKALVGNRFPSEGGPANPPASPLTSPFGVDFDSHGNMIIVELEGGRVHRLDTDGELHKIAGDGSRTYTGDGGAAASATFNAMHNVAIAKSDDIYIADSWNNCIRKIDAKTGIITTFAGTGESGFSGDGGPASEATFTYVMCITFSPDQRSLDIADINNHRVRRIDMATNTVTTIAGNGEKGVPTDGALANESPLVDPRAVTSDEAGNVYILERGGHALRVVSPDGRIRTIAGTGMQGHRDGPAMQAMFGAPKHLCRGEEGVIYIADDQNHAIRKYDPNSQTVTTILGQSHGDPDIRLKNPHGVTYANDRLYVVDMGHDRILTVE